MPQTREPWDMDEPEEPQELPPWDWAPVDTAYNKYLGRGRDPNDVQYEYVTGWEDMLKGSTEAQNFANRPKTQYGGQPDPNFGGYAELPGYDYGKLSDPTHRGSGKYNADVGLFSQALKATGAKPGQAGLQQVYDWMRGKGSNVQWGGKDVFKFGDIDVDVMGNYNPTGEGSSWTFQDPRGVAPADPQPGAAGVGGGAGTQSAGGPNVTPLNLRGILGGAGSGITDWMNTGLQDLFKTSMESINKPMGSAQFESLRQPIDKARRTALNAVRGELANRGTLMGGGDYTNAIGRIESDLAPDFASAVQRASAENVAGARGSALGALQGGNQNRAIRGDLALRQLDQNRQWNQFLADFGLRREQVLELLSQGRVDQLLQYYDIWQKGIDTAAEGQIT